MPDLRPPTPAIVSQAAVARLPRWGLWLLCFAYILPGFIGREPWKTADVQSFAAMQEIASGRTDSWAPLLLGQPVTDFAPLPLTLGAWAIQWLPTSAELAYKIPSMLALLAALAFTWHAIFRLALLPGAQPVAFAFGGQAQPVDYARALADSGLLVLMACLGLAQISHEVSPAVFCLASLAALMHAAALNTRAHAPDIWRWSPQWLGGLVLLTLSGQPVLALSAAGLLPLLHLQARCEEPRARHPNAPTLVTWGAGLMVAALGCWASPSFNGLEAPDTLAFAKQFAWFAWPAWPLALWALWRWRQHWRMPHLLLPLGLGALPLIGSALQDGLDRVLLPLLPPLAALAAFAIPTLKRTASALLDWFSLLFFTFCSVTVWVVWMAMMTGTPAQPAANVARLAPGFVPEFHSLATACAALATLVWAGVVYWRASRHPSALWKSMVIPATGSILCWLLLMTLWLPLLDHARSYGGMARRLANLVSPTGCAIAWNLQTAQMAGLVHQGHMQLQAGDPSSLHCDHLITSPEKLGDPTLSAHGWNVVTRVNRLTDNKEGLVLLARQVPADAVNPPEPDQTENAE